MKKLHKVMKERYPDVHPLIFQRSLDRAASDGELFDILETIPDDYPLVWNKEIRRWVTDKLLQERNLKNDLL